MPPYERGSTLLGLPVYWVDDLVDFADRNLAVCGLVTTHTYRFVEQARAHRMRFATVIHPTACVSGTAVIEEGSVISVGVVVAS